MHLKNMNRYQAFAIHMVISLILFLLLFVFIRYSWYPEFLFETAGGWGAIQLIIGIDIILGPLLTLLVFNATKPELKKDLAVIGLIQFSALIAGCGIIYKTRPVAVAYMKPEFFVVYEGTPQADALREKINSSNLALPFFKYKNNSESRDFTADSFEYFWHGSELNFKSRGITLKNGVYEVPFESLLGSNEYLLVDLKEQSIKLK